MLEIDPDTIGQAVRLFERYATGAVSIERLAVETGLEPDRVRYLLRNPLFNGWVRRHRGRNEIRRPAAWRANPPVSDELWAQVEEVRRSRTQGGGPRLRRQSDLWGGLLACVCGRRLRGDGSFGDGRYHKLHVGPCAEWGSQARYGDETWERPILAQLANIDLSDDLTAQIVAALDSGERPVTLDRARLERQMRELGARHLAGEIADEAYLTSLRDLRQRLAGVAAPSPGRLAADRAVAWLRALGATIEAADVPEAKAELAHAIYERITVKGPVIVSAKLTQSAYAAGLALALPQVVMARPEVSGFTT